MEEMGDLVSHRIVLVLLIFCVFGVFSPVIQNTYLYHDDYVIFQPDSGWCKGSPGSIGRFEMLGRPLGGWILCGYSKFIHSPEDGNFVRILVLLSLVVMAYLLYAYMVRNNISPLKATLLAALTITVPAVAIYAFWITASFMVIGIIFSIISGLIVYQVLEKEIHGLKKIFLLILSVGFFIAAISTYQPSAMVYWGLLAFSLWHWISDDDLSWVRKTIGMTSVGIISMGLYGLVYIPTSYQKLKAVDPSRLIHPLNSTFGKFHDFSVSTNAMVHELWFGNPLPWFSSALIGIIISGIAFSSIPFKKKVVLFLFYPILCILSFSPVLVSNFPNTFFRTMFPIWIVVIAYLSGALSSLPYMLKQRFRIVEIVLILFLIAGSVLQFHFVRDRLVKPSVFELGFVKEKLTQTLKRDPNVKTLFLCPLHYRLISQIYSDEYGSPTSSYDFYSGPHCQDSNEVNGR